MSETLLFILGAIGGYLVYKKLREKKQTRPIPPRLSPKPIIKKSETEKKYARLVVQLKGIGKPIYNVEVTLSNHETFSSRTNPAGLVAFNNVPPGEYTLTINTIPKKTLKLTLKEPKTYYVEVGV